LIELEEEKVADKNVKKAPDNLGNYYQVNDESTIR
jgi:hypothetical protein